MAQLAEPYTGTTMKSLYTGIVSVTGGLHGHARLSGRACSSDNVLNLELSLPSQLGGPGGKTTNPEQLFAAGYAACFHGSMALVSKSVGINVSNATVTCAVTIGRDPADGGYKLAAELTVEIPNVNREKIEQLVTKAYNMCPYSKAIRNNVDVTVTII